jgi:hypothetical protein
MYLLDMGMSIVTEGSKGKGTAEPLKEKATQ